MRLSLVLIDEKYRNCSKSTVAIEKKVVETVIGVGLSKESEEEIEPGTFVIDIKRRRSQIGLHDNFGLDVILN